MTDVQLWEGGEEQPGRLVWLKLEGIPTQAWSTESVERITQGIGKIIEISEEIAKPILVNSKSNNDSDTVGMEGDAYESDDDYDGLNVGGWESILSPENAHVAAVEDKGEEDQKSYGDSSIPNNNSSFEVQDFLMNEASTRRYAAEDEVANTSIEVEVEAAAETSTCVDNTRENIKTIVGEVSNSTYPLQQAGPNKSSSPCPIGATFNCDKSPIPFGLVNDNIDVNGPSHIRLETNVKCNPNDIGRSKKLTCSTQVHSTHQQHPSITNRVGGKLSFNMMLDVVRQKGEVRIKNDTVLKANEKKKKKIKKAHAFVIENHSGPHTSNDEHSSEYSTESAKIAGIGEKLGYNFDIASLGKVHKQKDFIHHEKLSVIGIQETKMEQIDQVFVNSLWIRDNVNFAFNGAFGKWSGINRTVFLINIYGSQEDHLKEELWDELSRQGVWILFGDLNAVRYMSERAGSIFNSREASAFNEFITRNGLFDFPMGGIRVISDHCHILLKNCHRDYGPRPFRIFDFWANYNDLMNWSCLLGVLVDIKAWSMEKILKDTQKSKSLKRQLVEWDQKAESGFKEPRVDRPKFRISLFWRIHESDALLLESSISMDELKWAVDDCSGTKAPGPDVINFNFIKRYWEILKLDFHKCVAHFEATGRLLKGVNPSFITHVPKIKDLIENFDFCPISLIGCVYKVISKVLASRLAKVIDKIISPN
ncbi:RNA-directed DNA polymerase, eukaryota, reverse transcriptase zinc-binding domain protein [Tanacetum coccineum]